MQHLNRCFINCFVIVTRQPLPFQAGHVVAKTVFKLPSESQHLDRFITPKQNFHQTQQPNTTQQTDGSPQKPKTQPATVNFFLSLSLSL